MAKYAKHDEEIVAGDDAGISLTFSELNGDPVSITGWSFYYKAEADWTTDTIEIAPAAMTLSNSGEGVVDTVDIPITDTESDIEAGFYGHEIARENATGDIETVLRGTLTITKRRTSI